MGFCSSRSMYSTFEFYLAKMRVPIEIASNISRRREMPIETSTSHETFRASARLFDVCGFNTFSTPTRQAESRVDLERAWLHSMRGVQMTGITYDTILIRSGMMIDLIWNFIVR